MRDTNKVLVTGGAGYIGSHTCLSLLSAGYEVVVFDNFSNSSRRAIDAIGAISGTAVEWAYGDLLEPAELADVFEAHRPQAVLHFAGLKAVGESVEDPLRYYRNNVVGTLHLIEAMENAGTQTLVFSSSATVYGVPERVPIPEGAATGPTNPYGMTKLVIEGLLRDYWQAHRDWRISILRYFNPAGAHPSGELGEDPVGTPNNLLPYVAQVAVGRLPFVRVFGDDYPTRDGTGVRDYIHVMDLAEGHVRALSALTQEPQCAVYNLGRGDGCSVKEVLETFERVSGRAIAFKIAGRRPGDVAESYADPTKANREFAWRAEKTLETMCEDTWRWQSRHPGGFGRG